MDYETPFAKSFASVEISIPSYKNPQSFQFGRDTKGEELFVKLAHHVQLPKEDWDFFGIEFPKNKQAEKGRWIRLDKPLRRQLPNSISNNFCLTFTLKIYPSKKVQPQSERGSQLSCSIIHHLITTKQIFPSANRAIQLYALISMFD